MSLAASRLRRVAGPRRLGPPLTLRARVLLRRGTLDRLLAAGSDPGWDPELALRAAQVTARGKRQVLADGIERAVREANEPSRWTCAAPLDRRAVRAAAPELRALAAGLRAVAMPDAQGVALAGQLLRDPSSPLYASGDEEALRGCAKIALRALG